MEEISKSENPEEQSGNNSENKGGDAPVPDGGTAPQPVKPKKKFSFKYWLLGAILPVLSSGIIRALAIHIFTTPNKFAPGGTNGIAVLLEEATGWNSGIFLLIISVPLFFVAFFCLGKKEAVLSTMSFVVSSGVLMLLPLIPGMPQYGGDGEIVHGIFGAVAGGIFLGVALAIMIKSCGTSGGTTILASVINKKFRNLSVSMLTAAFDAIVVFASIFVYGWGKSFTDAIDPVLLALVSLFVTSKMCDVILQGFKVAYKFEIVTTHPDEIAAEIMKKTNHSVTKVEAEGMYSHEGKSMLVCIIRKRQIAVIQRIIRKYPDTFAYFTPASEVFGRFTK